MSEFWDLRYEILYCTTRAYRKKCLDAYSVECKKIIEDKLESKIKELEDKIAFLEPANEGLISKVEKLEADLHLKEVALHNAHKIMDDRKEENQRLRDVLDEIKDYKYNVFIDVKDMKKIAQKALEGK